MGFGHNKNLNFILDHFKRRSFVTYLVSFRELEVCVDFFVFVKLIYSWFCIQTQGKVEHNQVPSV